MVLHILVWSDTDVHVHFGYTDPQEQRKSSEKGKMCQKQSDISDTYNTERWHVCHQCLSVSRESMKSIQKYGGVFEKPAHKQWFPSLYIKWPLLTLLTARISTSDKRFISLVFFVYVLISHFTRALCDIFTLTLQMGLWWEWKAAHQRNDNNPNYFEMKSILSFISTMPAMTAWLMSSEKARTLWNVWGDVFTPAGTVQSDDEWKENWGKTWQTRRLLHVCL